MLKVKLSIVALLLVATSVAGQGPVRLDCTKIVSVTKGAPYANGDQRWTIRGTCTEQPGGTVVETPPAVPALLPAEVRTTWAPGVAGGIPPRATVCATVPLGGNIQAAIDACPEGQTVHLVAGEYPTPAPVLLNKGITLRGAGKGVTVLRKADGSVEGSYIAIDNRPVVLMGRSRWPHLDDATSVGLATDAVAGSRTVTVASATGLAAGQIVLIDEDDYGHAAWVPTVGVERVWASDRVVYQRHDPPRQWVDDPFPASLTWFSRSGRPVNELKEIASVSGQTVTFTSALHATYRAARQAQLTRHDTRPLRGAGLEDVTLAGGGDGNLRVEATVDSWAARIESTSWGGEGVGIQHSLRFELRDSDIHHTVWPYPGGAGYAISLAWGSSDVLLENNAVWDANKVLVMRSAGAGSVVGYNAMDDGFIGNVDGWQEVGLNASHMVGGHHVLFEGNDAFNYDSDNTHGTAFGMTIFRNWLRGRRSSHPDTSNARAAGLMVGSWWHAFIGNVLGEPGRMAGWVLEGTDPNVPAIWRLGYDAGAWSNPPDAQTRARVTRDGNFDYVSGTTWWSAGARGLPDSLYLAGKPAFFGARPWPWVTPTGTTKVGALPARERITR